MNPDAALEELCARYALPRPFARRLLPLVRRAQSSPPEQCRFLMGLVERSFAREAERRRAADDRRSVSEEQALLHLAGTLHAWNPPNWFKEWAKDLGAMDAFEPSESESGDPPLG